MIHALKTINPYFQQVWDLEKQFELRKNDRNFQVGDDVILQEYSAENGYSGRAIKYRISCLLNDFEGIQEGYCIFGFGGLINKE